MFTPIYYYILFDNNLITLYEIHFGIILAFFSTTYLTNYFKSLKGLSKITPHASPPLFKYYKTDTAPILLPHKQILFTPFLLCNSFTISIRSSD